MPLLLCCALVGSTAEAQGGGVVLEWSPASECASRAALVAEVERLLGRTLSEAPPTQVSAVVLRHDPDLRLELRMEREGHASSRTLDGPSCEALVRAAALIIAVAIDPEAVADNDPELDSELDPPSEPEPRDPPAATQLAESTEHEPHEARAAAPAALSDVRFIGALAPGLAIGPLPDPAAALTVSIGIGAGAFELTLAGLVTPEQAARLEGSDAAGRLGLALGRLRGCVSFEPAGDQLELLPCLAVEAGAMWGRGENVPVVRSGAAPWVAGAAGLEARFWIADALALGLSAELVVPFVPVRFILTLEGAAEELHRAADAGALITPAPEPERQPAEEQAAPRPVRPRITAPAPAPPALAEEHTLIAETALLRSAHRALREGAPDRALALLNTHSARYPRGALREECAATRVLALCALDRRAEAQAEIAAFLAAYPNSMHTARVRAACAAP